MKAELVVSIVTLVFVIASFMVSVSMIVVMPKGANVSLQHRELMQMLNIQTQALLGKQVDNNR